MSFGDGPLSGGDAAAGDGGDGVEIGAGGDAEFEEAVNGAKVEEGGAEAAGTGGLRQGGGHRGEFEGDLEGVEAFVVEEGRAVRVRRDGSGGLGVDWFNNRRLLEPIGNVPPAEKEAAYYETYSSQAMTA